LFPRIDLKSIDKEGSAGRQSRSKTPIFKPEISFEEFAKVDLRLARVTSARAIPKAKKLLELTIDLGETRTIVAGIAEHYSPEELIGMQVIVVANLKPAKLMGVVSQGMLVAAVDENVTAVATVEQKLKPGTPLH